MLLERLSKIQDNEHNHVKITYFLLEMHLEHVGFFSSKTGKTVITRKIEHFQKKKNEGFQFDGIS